MKPEAMNVVIAELCGWEFRTAPHDPEVLWRKYGFAPRSTLPNYSGDLNAMQAEILKQPLDTQWLIQGQLQEIRHHRSKAYGGVNFPIICMPVQYWAEAFIKTLAPEKWREE